jgi:hypothetical protein
VCGGSHFFLAFCLLFSQLQFCQDAVVKPFIGVDSGCGNDFRLLSGLHLPFHPLKSFAILPLVSCFDFISSLVSLF